VLYRLITPDTKISVLYKIAGLHFPCPGCFPSESGYPISELLRVLSKFIILCIHRIVGSAQYYRSKYITELGSIIICHNISKCQCTHYCQAGSEVANHGAGQSNLS